MPKYRFAQHHSLGDKLLRRLPTLQQLNEVARQVDTPEFAGDEEYFNGLGLFGLFTGEMEYSGDWCTPRNSLTFASTGGDGTHFSFLLIGGALNDESPIVMTCPASSDRPNMIVGANLRDFLCLGMHCGYFVLEQLLYSRGKYDVRESDHITPTYRRVLDFLVERLSLTPWLDVADRLQALEYEFSRHVVPAFSDLTRDHIQTTPAHDEIVPGASTLARLWWLREKDVQLQAITSEIGIFGPRDALGTIGLNLVPLQPGGYWCTPRNSLAFAFPDTRGNHFSLVTVDGRVDEGSPVVLTLPCGGDGPRQIIVGENLHDFLCLGSRGGYQLLDALAHTTRYLRPQAGNGDAESETAQRTAQILSLLTAEFSLRPWKTVHQKLDRLYEQYYHLLDLPFENDD